MKIVIEISESIYDKINQHNVFPSDVDTICNAIFLGIPLPEHHGRIIDESKITKVWYHEEEATNGNIVCRSIIIDRTDAPTIIEGSENV